MMILLRLGFDSRCALMSPPVDPVGQLVPPPHGGPTMRAVKEDVPADPRDVGLLRATAVVPRAHRLADAIEESRFGWAGGAGLTDRECRYEGASRRYGVRRSRRSIGE